MLEKIHKKTLQHFPLNPLQKKTRIPFEMFSAPLKMREDLEFKRKTYRTEANKEYRDITSPADLLEIEGAPVERVFILGEPGRGKTGQCFQLVQHWLQGKQAIKEDKEMSDWQKGLASFDFLFPGHSSTC